MKSAAYWALVSAGGPVVERKLDGDGIANGVIVAIDGTRAGTPSSSPPAGFGRGVGRHLPTSIPPTKVDGEVSRPSVLRHRRMSCATRWPHAAPRAIDVLFSIALLSAIPASDASRSAANDWDWNSAESVVYAAYTTAARFDAPRGASTVT